MAVEIGGNGFGFYLDIIMINVNKLFILIKIENNLKK